MSIISKQIEELNEEARRMHDAEKYAWAVITQRAADTIKELSAKVRANNLHDDWIPVSETLPKKYAQYLVCFKTGHCYVYWLEDSDWTRDMVEKEGIIAWMSLPKPYREDGDDEII